MTNKLKPLSKIIGKIKGNVRIALPFFGIASLINGIIGTKNGKIDGKIPIALRVFGLVGGIIINIRIALWVFGLFNNLPKRIIYNKIEKGITEPNKKARTEA